MTVIFNTTSVLFSLISSITWWIQTIKLEIDYGSNFQHRKCPFFFDFLYYLMFSENVLLCKCIINVFITLIRQPTWAQWCISYRNQITGFYIKYKIWLKWVKSAEELKFMVHENKNLLPANESFPVKVLYSSGCSNSKASTKCFMPPCPFRLIKSRNWETLCILVFPEFITLSQSSSSITPLLRR